MSSPAADGDVVLVPDAAALGDVRGWGVEHAGRLVGTIGVRRSGGHVGELSWSTPAVPDLDALRRGLRLAVEQVVLIPDLRRVEARVPAGDVAGQRSATFAGLRREGVLRGAAPDGSDDVLLARLADDPPVASREGLVAMLNAGLPTKRVIAHGVLRDPSDRVLLCELTYKREWDLPGGVVEPGESPLAGVVREVREELGIDVVPQRLLTVNWLAPWRGWDDACVFVFDLGVHESSLSEAMVLQPTEISAVYWCDATTAAERGAAATGGLLAFLAGRPEGVPYLEGAAEPTL